MDKPSKCARFCKRKWMRFLRTSTCSSLHRSRFPPPRSRSIWKPAWHFLIRWAPLATFAGCRRSPFPVVSPKRTHRLAPAAPEDPLGSIFVHKLVERASQRGAPKGLCQQAHRGIETRIAPAALSPYPDMYNMRSSDAAASMGAPPRIGSAVLVKFLDMRYWACDVLEEG